MVADKVYKNVEDVRKEIVMAFEAPKASKVMALEPRGPVDSVNESPEIESPENEKQVARIVGQLRRIEGEWMAFDVIPDGLELE